MVVAPERRRSQGDRGRARDEGEASEGAFPVTPDAGSAREFAVRDADEADMPAVRDIYAHYVLSSLATFEETPPSVDVMLARRRTCLDNGLPYLAAVAEGEVMGFAYAGPYHARPAYRFAIEDSVYVAEGLRGRGVGSALLTVLIERCEAGPWRQMIAIVGDSANAGSIELHRRFGFELMGVLRSVGYKFGRWVDTPILQRALGAGDGEAPRP